MTVRLTKMPHPAEVAEAIPAKVVHHRVGLVTDWCQEREAGPQCHGDDEWPRVAPGCRRGSDRDREGEHSGGVIADQLGEDHGGDQHRRKCANRPQRRHPGNDEIGNRGAQPARIHGGAEPECASDEDDDVEIDRVPGLPDGKRAGRETSPAAASEAWRIGTSPSPVRTTNPAAMSPTTRTFFSWAGGVASSGAISRKSRPSRNRSLKSAVSQQQQRVARAAVEHRRAWRQCAGRTGGWQGRLRRSAPESQSRAGFDS